MKLIKPGYEILSEIDRESILKKIEIAGRTCYKSEEKITEESASKFVKAIVKRGHLSVIEHVDITVKFICDRGVTHELVRHRLASYSQESTRYCNYSGGVTFIIPCWFEKITPGTFEYNNTEYKNYTGEFLWFYHMLNCEKTYQKLLKEGWTPQQARSVLPNSLKTEIVTTANLREWMHIFKMRCAKDAHPQIREIMIPLRNELATILPEIYA
jgi:thymidylate synthase (FAD)